MEPGDKESVRKSGKRGPKGRRAQATARRAAGNSRLREAVVSLDAEDIALARLQAHLRRAETIQNPSRSATGPAVRRTTVRLSDSLIRRLRERAQREGTTASEIVQRALERFLRSR